MSVHLRSTSGVIARWVTRGNKSQIAKHIGHKKLLKHTRHEKSKADTRSKRTWCERWKEGDRYCYDLASRDTSTSPEGFTYAFEPMKQYIINQPFVLSRSAASPLAFFISIYTVPHREGHMHMSTALFSSNYGRDAQPMNDGCDFSEVTEQDTASRKNLQTVIKGRAE